MSNFNNNFLTNNNNMNNNSIVHKNHKSDTSNNNDHKSGQCVELKTAAAVASATKTATANAACSAKKTNRSDDGVAVIRHEIDIEGDIDVDDDDNDGVEDDGDVVGGGGGDVNETDTRSSSKSNFSNIDVECERDERKPNVKNFSGIMQSVAQDSSSSAGWISCSSPADKLMHSDATTMIYTNCGTGDTTTTHPPANNGCNLMVNNFKKEVSKIPHKLVLRIHKCAECSCFVLMKKNLGEIVYK